MSRITDGPIVAGDELDAVSLNTRFGSYTQTDLNTFNHRDAAHDLPQFAESGWLLTHAQSQDIGKNDWKHTSSVTLTTVSYLDYLRQKCWVMNSKPTSLLPYLTRRLLAEFKVGYGYEGPFLRVSRPRLQGVENYLQCY